MFSENHQSDMAWNTSPQNLPSWADKETIQLNKLISALKKIAFRTVLILSFIYPKNKLMVIEHLYCLAHARTKFKLPTIREAYKQELP